MNTPNDPVLVRHIQACLEQFAHPSLQESYDNCGLQVGNPDQSVSGILYSLDVTLGILNEALEGVAIWWWPIIPLFLGA